MLDYAKRTIPGLSFGVHLTHTAEWGGYRWGPVAPDNLVPGLAGPGWIPCAEDVSADLPKLYSPEEAYIEARAQIEKFIAAGLEPTHIDSHMGTMMMNPEYFEDVRQAGRGI